MTPLAKKILGCFHIPVLVEPDSSKTVSKNTDIVSISFAGCYCLIIISGNTVTLCHIYPLNKKTPRILKTDRVIQFYYKDLPPLPIRGKKIAYNNRGFSGNFIGVKNQVVKYFNLDIKI